MSWVSCITASVRRSVFLQDISDIRGIFLIGSGKKNHFTETQGNVLVVGQ